MNQVVYIFATNEKSAPENPGDENNVLQTLN